VAAVLVVTAIVNLVGDEGSDLNPTDVSMALPPPVEPSAVTTAPEPEPPEFALGWKELDLPGSVPGGTFGRVVDAGPSGWVAVTHGNFAPMVHTSDDGVVWHTTTLEEVGGTATVYSGTQGLFVAVLDVPAGTGIWRSVDGGIGWERSTLPGDGAVVLSVSEAAGRVWAAGMVGWPDPWSTGTPAVWVLEGEAWIPVALEGERGWVASVLEWEGGVWGFGSDDGPMVWDLVGAKRFEVSSDTAQGGFRTVVAHQGALWSLFTLDFDESGRLVSSPDPFSWDFAPNIRNPIGMSLEPVGELLAVVDRSGVKMVPAVTEVAADSLLSESIASRLPNRTTGRESSDSVSGLAVDGDQAVILGTVPFYDTMLWARGTTSQPIILLERERIVWSARRELSVDVSALGQMIRWEERVFVVGPGGVLEWMFGTDLVEVPGGRDVYVLRPTDAGLLALGPTGVLILNGIRFDDFGSVPSPDLCGSAVVGGQLRVISCAGDMWELGANGEWSLLARTPYRVVGSLDGAFIAFDPLTGEEGVTVDGTTLEFRGQLEWGLTGRQHPFVVLERRSDSATVRLLEPWPDGATFEVPTPAPLEVTQVWDEWRVQSPSTLYISTDQFRSWTEVPIGVENGFPEGGSFLPTAALMVIAPNPDGSGSTLYTPDPEGGSPVASRENPRFARSRGDRQNLATGHGTPG
jgi:hypothetical protein